MQIITLNDDQDIEGIMTKIRNTPYVQIRKRIYNN